MLTVDQIEDYLGSDDIEWTTVELKREVPETDSPKRNLAKVVVAFANTAGAHLIIGADDEKPPDGPRPVYDVCPPGPSRDEVIRTVRQIIDDRTEPSIRHRVNLDPAYLSSRGVTVLQVSVHPPGESDPLCYLRDGQQKFVPYCRVEKQCLAMKPDEIASFGRRLVEEEAKRKAEELSEAVDRAVDHVLTVVASRILELGGLATEQVFESALLEGCQGDEEVRERARRRLNIHPLLRRIEDGYDFPNETLRAYYAAGDLAQRPSDELVELLSNPRYDQVWLYVFTHLRNRQVAEVLLNHMIQAGQVERALQCYYVRQDREVGDISERLTGELLWQVRRVLAESTDLQMLVINNIMVKDPYAEVRRTVLGGFDPCDYSGVPPSVLVERLLERVQSDPNRNCQAAAAGALLRIEIPDDHRFSVTERAFAMIESLTGGNDFDVAEDAEIWGPLSKLVDRIGSPEEVAVLVERLLGLVESDREINCRVVAASALLEVDVPETDRASVAERAIDVVEASIASDLAAVRATGETEPIEPTTEDLWLPLVELLARTGTSQAMADKLAELEQRISEAEEMSPTIQEEWLRAIGEARIVIEGRVASGDSQ